MTSKADKDKTKQLQDKCQSVLNALLRDEDNKYCVDCDSKGPRWASWNIGVFLCIRCAGIHRNLGVHISKVKSVNLDSWTPEQVVSLQQMGNSRARAVYEANLPDNHRRPQSDSALETFIRAKYEHKKYIASEWVPPALPKVNWEKEIDEELERQRRKKKSHSGYLETKSIANVEVPQLPKPTIPSPKPVRQNHSQTKQKSAVSASAEEKNSSSSSNAADLLGLQNGEDGFGGFLSASTIDNKTSFESKEEKRTAAQSEEESFFNQLAPTEKEKAKLTKDSILALYSNTPAVNKFNSTFQSQPFHSSFVGNQSQQSFPNFAGAAYHQHQPQQPTHNLASQQPTLPAMASQFNTNSSFSQLTPQGNPSYPQQYNQQQFASQQQTTHFSNTIPAANSFAHMGQFPQQHNNQSFATNQGNVFMMGQTNIAGANSGATIMQPIGGSLPQQFGNLTLNGQPNSNPTLASTNLWQ